VIVHPDHQGKGIGSKLMQWGIELADKEKLVGWLNARPSGRKMYEKAGFRIVTSVPLDMPGLAIPPSATMLRPRRD